MSPSGIRRRVLLAAALALTIAAPAAAARDSAADVDLVDALDRIALGVWHPMPTDPAWLAVRPALDRELAASPAGRVAVLARRAAVRIEVGVAPLVSHDARASELTIDTRPWFTAATALPYIVELHASLNGGESALLAIAQSGAQCNARVAEIAWPSTMTLGFHHVTLWANVYQVRANRLGKRPRCAVRVRHARAPALPAGVDSALWQERKQLPALAFGLLHLQRSVHHPGLEPTDRSDSRLPEYSPFIEEAERALASGIEPDLPAVGFGRWLETTVREVAPGTSHPLSWVPPGFCDADEGLWYRGIDKASEQEQVWHAASHLRHQPRAICATALMPVDGGILTVRLRVGTVLEDRNVWTVQPPSSTRPSLRVA